MKWREMASKGYKIIRWYEVKGAGFDHLLCAKSDKSLMVQYWKNGEKSTQHTFADDDADKANALIKSLLLTASEYRIRSKSDILKTLALLGIDNNFVG